MKSRLFVACSFVLFSATSAHGQYAWFTRFESSNDVAASRLAIDSENNLYTLVNFAGSVTIQGQTLNGGGALLAKLNSLGELVWFKRFTYSALTFVGLGDLAIDAQDNIYVQGQFPASANIGGTVVTGGDHNTFIAKFKSDGNLIWVKTLLNVQEIFQMSVNPGGEIAITGRHYETFSVGHISLTITNGYNTFGALLDSNGVTQWATVFGTATAVTNQPVSVTVDNNGNYYFCGRYSGPMKIGSKEVAPNPSGDYNMYIVKINRQGTCEWLIDGLRQPYPPYAAFNVGEWGDLETDADGNLYAGGTFWQNLVLGSHTVTGTAQSIENIYVAKIDSQGNVLWITPTVLQSGNNTIAAMLARDGKIHTTGLYGSNPYYRILNAADGTELSAYQTFPFMGDVAGGIAIDDNDGVYMSGRIYGPMPSFTRNGFVFKIGNNNIVAAANIMADAAICYGEKIIASTAPLPNATWYEWELVYSDGTTIYAQTFSPELEIPINGVIGAKTVSIRVRGRNDDAAGQYSPANIVSVHVPPQTPVIEIVCNDVHVVQGDATAWYKDGEQLTDVPDGENTIVRLDKGEYYVVNNNICGSAISNTVAFEPLIIPNIITPNGDFKNDLFVIDERLVESQVKIINRWGDEVFASGDYQNNWNGESLPSGVYFFTIQNGCLDTALKGPVTIAR